MKINIIFAICLLLNAVCTNAQVDSVNILFGNINRITLPVNTRITNKEFNLNRLHHSFCLAVPVAAIGFAIMPADHHISNKVMSGMPSFHTRADDDIRYLPLATQLAMGLSGVKGRSKNRWQLIATDAMATTIMETIENY